LGTRIESGVERAPSSCPAASLARARPTQQRSRRTISCDAMPPYMIEWWVGCVSLSRMALSEWKRKKLLRARSRTGGRRTTNYLRRTSARDYVRRVFAGFRAMARPQVRMTSEWAQAASRGSTETCLVRPKSTTSQIWSRADREIAVAYGSSHGARSPSPLLAAWRGGRQQHQAPRSATHQVPVCAKRRLPTPRCGNGFAI
jgi:hypothetical protein